MIIACPACSTRYDVPDISIGIDGRVVRCAKCRHSWFQDGPQAAEPSVDMPAVLTPPQPEPAPSPDVATAEPATAPGYYAELPAREFAETPSSFAHEPPFRPRRKRVAVWLIVVVLVALMALAAVAAVAEFGVPDWLPLPHGAFGGQAQDLALDFPKDLQQRRPLPNGGDFFNVSGTIRNSGHEQRAVPTLLIVLRDGQNNIVYSLETAAPKAALAPGESEIVNQAITDAPASARTAEIGWKPR